MNIQAWFVKLFRLIRNRSRQCSDCDEAFLTYEGLLRHQEVEHGEDFVVFRCTECGKIYQSLPALHGHAEKHTGFLSFGNIEELMQYTEKLKIVEYWQLDAAEDQPHRGENPK